MIAVHLAISILVGVYVGKLQDAGKGTGDGKGKGKGKGGTEDHEDYFLAGRAQSSCSIAISLVSGLMSGISFLGST